ncbi:phosphatidylserine/phosphatidylglycerophosphate/cardiolipin synthase family protein, partial [bacterium]|nr:phosphatidylserine/phosphatidylglycerophosphate/cardiolipin synthase family protein [bacterium]
MKNLFSNIGLKGGIMVLILGFWFTHPATCQAGEEAAVLTENVRVASLNISPLVILPEYREITATAMVDPVKPVIKRVVGEVSTLNENMKVANLNISSLIALPEYREIPLTELEFLNKPEENGTNGPGGTHAFAHLAGSHLGIITRPVSAVTKLLSMLFYTGQDTLRNVLLEEVDPEPLLLLNNGPGMDLNQWESDLDKITGTKLSSGRIKLLIDGDEFYSRLTRSFLEADSSIDVRIYIYDNDDYAMGIAELLKKKSMDIDVRVLTDGLGTIMANRVHPETVPVGHQPAVSVKDHFTKDSNVKMRYQKNLWLTLDHTKTIMVDRRTAFIG